MFQWSLNLVRELLGIPVPLNARDWCNLINLFKNIDYPVTGWISSRNLSIKGIKEIVFAVKDLEFRELNGDT